MICKRCGSRCLFRSEGVCFHCLVALEIDKATGGKISNGTIQEGFPDWEKPHKDDKVLPERPEEEK